MKRSGIFRWVIAMSSSNVPPAKTVQKNKEKQSTCNFGRLHYEEILKAGLASGYQFIGFDELSKCSPTQKICIMRHDVDYMPEWAPSLGKIENNLGIKATYFFQICAKPYNLRESKNYGAVQALVKMGHTIGLHFDLTWKKDMEWEDAARFCKQEKAVFKAITGVEPCDIISFHNPHRFTDLILNQDIAGLHHTYEKKFFSEIKYISDSQGWYEGCMCKLFESGKYPRVQFLTHPYIWPEVTTGDFISDMARMIKLRADELTQYMLNFHPVCKRNETRLRDELKKL